MLCIANTCTSLPEQSVVDIIGCIQSDLLKGKTRVIIEAIKLLKLHWEVPFPILVCAHTNVAVDNLLEGLNEYSVKACNTMKSLCLALAGAIRLEKLTIVVKPGDQDSSDVDLADILWPLLLLRTDVKVEFEGITADPEEASTMEWETGSE